MFGLAYRKSKELHPKRTLLGRSHTDRLVTKRVLTVVGGFSLNDATASGDVIRQVTSFPHASSYDKHTIKIDFSPLKRVVLKDVLLADLIPNFGNGGHSR